EADDQGRDRRGAAEDAEAARVADLHRQRAEVRSDRWAAHVPRRRCRGVDLGAVRGVGMTAVATPETPALDLKQAQRLTERARLVATTLMEAREKLAAILREANEGRVWEALGMPNIQAWAAFTFSDSPLAQLSIDDRRVLVKELAEEGYGVRAIAPIVGTTKSSVDRDLKAS